MKHEWAITLGDVLLRRTTLGLAACQALHCLEQAAQLVGRAHGWDAVERDRQQSAYRAELVPMRVFSTR